MWWRACQPFRISPCAAAAARGRPSPPTSRLNSASSRDSVVSRISSSIRSQDWAFPSHRSSSTARSGRRSGTRRSTCPAARRRTTTSRRRSMACCRNPDSPASPARLRARPPCTGLSGCEVTTNGARIEVSFPGVTLGVFSGRLQFTVYRGANLIRQEIIAKTDASSVAYKYDAGLAGLAIGPSSRVLWRGMTNLWQDYHLGSAPSEAPVTLKTSNRIVVAESPAGSIAAFPPPHTFFWARETSYNLGYNWYRQGQPDVVRIRCATSRERRESGRRGSRHGGPAPEFRAAQRPPRHVAADARVFLRESGERTGNDGRRVEVHERRSLQAARRLPGDGDALSHGPAQPRAEIRRARRARAGSRSAEGGRHHHRGAHRRRRRVRRQPVNRRRSGLQRRRSEVAAVEPRTRRAARVHRRVRRNAAGGDRTRPRRPAAALRRLGTPILTAARPITTKWRRGSPTRTSS